MHGVLTWAIAAAAVALMLTRPLRSPEWVWPALASAILVASGLLSGRQAAQAALDGVNVYAFLLGMLALAELARAQGLFDRVTALLTERAGGDAARLFALLFGIAIAVTALLSNDGTIVLLTPVAIALARSAKVHVMPFAYTIAFVANAASFILPISNPANLVVFSPLPSLVPWLTVFAAPSAVALAWTFAALRWRCKGQLQQTYEVHDAAPPLTPAARLTVVTIGAALALLVAAAGLGLPVGYVALALAIVSVGVVTLRDRTAPADVLKHAAWSVIPLVGGLFVIVRALDQTGALELARGLLRHASAMSPVIGRLYTGGIVTLGDTLLNNLPTGVVVRYALRGHDITSHVTHAALVGIDLGPNLSLSGSLATLLWVMILRRDGIEVNAWRFLALGTIVTIPSLACALAVLR